MMPAWYKPPRYVASTSLGIIAKVARLHGLTADDLRGPSRTAELCVVRWRAMKALQDAGLSIAAIGRRLNRDHSTVINGLRRLQE